jgi:hypothetical protein
MVRTTPNESSEARLWRDCGLISEEIGRRSRQTRFRAVYRLGEATLELETDDESLASRFSDIYEDCRDGSTPALRVAIATHPSEPWVLLTADATFNGIAEFISFVFQDRRISAGPTEDGWTLLLRDGAPFAATDDRSTLIFERGEGWQSFAGNVAVNLLMRLQPGVLFFHAATCSIGGSAVMITGNKRSGKTTTALTLASRGHALLGDEVAAIRTDSWEALPFRRALSVRDGIRGSEVTRALAAAERTTEIFPDGEPRIRVHAAELFDAIPAPAPLRAAFFTRSFADKPQIEPIPRSIGALRLLQPLGCTLWNNDGNRSTVQLLRFFERTNCYYLDPGDPDETAAAIERCLEESCP